MEISNLIPHIEALIFASEKPLTTLEITDLINNAFGFMEDKITLDQIESAIEGILEKYRAEFYPFEVRESGGGWQFLTKKEYHKTVGQLNGEKFLKRLSTAALETLSIIAYKQPVTKGEIEAIRGVSSDYAIQKLLEKDLIVITGRNENLPGHPLVYNTSKNFMDYFGLNSPEDLPKLKEVFDDNFVGPTAIEPASTENPDAGTLPSANGDGLNGAEVAFTEEGAADENSEAEAALTDAEFEASAEEDAVNDEAAEEAADESDEEAAIEEEAEALDEEADQVLDEIADEYEEGDEETFGEGDEEVDEEEGVEGFEEEEAYITPEEDAGDDESHTSFKVGENGELIEEDHDDENDEPGDNDGKDKPDEERK